MDEHLSVEHGDWLVNGTGQQTGVGAHPEHHALASQRDDDSSAVQVGVFGSEGKLRQTADCLPFLVDGIDELNVR